MHKVEFFANDNDINGHTLTIEEKVNKWLKENQEITIHKMYMSVIAELSSFGPIEDVSGSEDFSKMNRGQDVMTESERAKRLEQRLAEAEEELTMLSQEIEEKNTTIEVLKEKSTPELLKELQEKFADTPGLIDAKKLQKDMYFFSIL